LIYQWIAHGFVTTNQAQQPEDVGIDYFNFLLKVGFLQDPIQHHYESDVECKMHDLVYDLARQILRDELVSEIATSDQIKGCRYFSIYLWLHARARLTVSYLTRSMLSTFLG
jgi:hypothetical protein